MLSHPQVIHFPIALLLTAVLFDLISYLWQKEFFKKASLVLLGLGVLAAFVAVQTGQNAEEAVEHLPDIKALLHNHEEAAEMVLYLFSVAFVLQIGAFFVVKAKKIIYLLSTLIMLAGVVKIYQAGHFGGQMVFERGAGVKPYMESLEKNNPDQKEINQE